MSPAIHLRYPPSPEPSAIPAAEANASAEVATTKRRYRAFPTLLRPVAMLLDRLDRQIEVTAMMVGAHGGLLEVVSHERHPQRVSILFPDRRLRPLASPGSGSLIQEHGPQGTIVILELGSRETIQLRFREERESPPVDLGLGGRVLVQSLGEVLEPEPCFVADV